MGDRISVSFKNKDDESVTLFSHWGGRRFLAEAQKYVRELKKERKGQFNPIDRFEPDTVMVDFIRHLTRNVKRVESDLYLGKDASCGDNSDNGHFTIDLPSGQVE